MEIIEKKTIIEILNRIDLLSEIEQGFISYSKGNCVIPPIGELEFDEPPGDVHIKYGYIKGESNYVIKIASGHWKNHELGIPNGNGMMLLFNQKTGQPLAILYDHGILTDIRTAVAGQICAKTFSNKIKRIGVIGTGTQAKLQVEYLKNITESRDVMVWGRDDKKMDQYKQHMEKIGFEVTFCKSPHEVASECNLIITATASKDYVLSNNDILEGTHINAIGSDTPSKRELGPGIIEKADLVIADSIEQCKYRGEIACSIRDGNLNLDNVVELGNVLSGKNSGRESKSQITVSDLTGVAVQDIKIADSVYKKFMEDKNEI